MRLYAAALAALLVASGSLAPSAVGQLRSADTSADQPRAVPRVVTLEDARLKFEINSTDQDGGVQVFIDAEEWKTMSIFDPQGNRIFSTQTSRQTGQVRRFGALPRERGAAVLRASTAASCSSSGRQASTSSVAPGRTGRCSAARHG